MWKRNNSKEKKSQTQDTKKTFKNVLDDLKFFMVSI